MPWAEQVSKLQQVVDTITDNSRNNDRRSGRQRHSSTPSCMDAWKSCRGRPSSSRPLTCQSDRPRTKRQTQHADQREDQKLHVKVSGMLFSSVPKQNKGQNSNTSNIKGRIATQAQYDIDNGNTFGFKTTNLNVIDKMVMKNHLNGTKNIERKH